jgi:hypothetical protein
MLNVLNSMLNLCLTRRIGKVVFSIRVAPTREVVYRLPSYKNGDSKKKLKKKKHSTFLTTDMRHKYLCRKNLSRWAVVVSVELPISNDV